MKESSSESDKDRLVLELRELKESTGGLMLENEVAVDIARLHNSYDVVLNSVFENMEAVGKYAAHPNHLKVLETIKALCSKTVKADYLLPSTA